ncbi:unnamed protein product [Pleuronectes platessa]|uniref:Uncharacterized protein n=1 Tax=Pleuronectes platessa TaxID=8262 RepID=A0A9N7UIB0_PLEPL|nr:unnamed protein product [Pleuronectes platessa]
MNTLKLKELSNSDLYRRRQERPDSYGSLGSLSDLCLDRRQGGLFNSSNLPKNRRPQ